MSIVLIIDSSSTSLFNVVADEIKRNSPHLLLKWILFFFTET
jgi:hypothetical protein